MTFKAKIILTLIINLAIIGGLLYFTKPSFTTEVAVDMFIGTLVEVFTFTIILHLFEQRQEKRNFKHLEAHLNKLENLIAKAEAKREDKK